MSKPTRTRRLEDVKKPVGRATGEVIVTTQLGEIMRDFERKQGIGGTVRADLEEKRAEAMEKKFEAKKLGYEVEAKKKERELERLDESGAGGQPAMIFFPVRQKGKILIKRLKLNPGEVEVVGEVPTEEEDKGKKEGKEAVSLVKETTEAVKAGIAVGKEAAGGGKGINSDEVRKIMEDKIEAYRAKLDARFDKLDAKLEKIAEGKGTKSDELSVIKELDALGLLRKTTEKDEGKEGGLSGLSKTIKELEDAGLVVRATKVNQEAAKLEFDKEKEGMSFWLAARKLVVEEKKALMEERTRREKIKMFKDFAKDIGKAVAEGLEESEEEGEEVRGKEEQVIEESEKTTAGIETFVCETEIEPGVKCGAKISIPPEAQKEGYRLPCPKCGSEYQYVVPKEKKNK